MHSPVNTKPLSTRWQHWNRQSWNSSHKNFFFFFLPSSRCPYQETTLLLFFLLQLQHGAAQLFFQLVKFIFFIFAIDAISFFSSSRHTNFFFLSLKPLQVYEEMRNLIKFWYFFTVSHKSSFFCCLRKRRNCINRWYFLACFASVGVSTFSITLAFRFPRGPFRFFFAHRLMQSLSQHLSAISRLLVLSRKYFLPA